MDFHPHCQGALLDLVYNRGPSLGSQRKPGVDRRKEMREIGDAFRNGQPEHIPGSLRRMIDIRDPKTERGLIIRHLAEADLFEKGLQCNCWR